MADLTQPNAFSVSVFKWLPAQAGSTPEGEQQRKTIKEKADEILRKVTNGSNSFEVSFGELKTFTNKQHNRIIFFEAKVEGLLLEFENEFLTWYLKTFCNNAYPESVTSDEIKILDMPELRRSYLYTSAIVPVAYFDLTKHQEAALILDLETFNQDLQKDGIKSILGNATLSGLINVEFNSNTNHSNRLEDDDKGKPRFGGDHRGGKSLAIASTQAPSKAGGGGRGFGRGGTRRTGRGATIGRGAINGRGRNTFRGFRDYRGGFRRYAPEWNPITKLGRLVKEGKITMLEEIYRMSIPIKEPQIMKRIADQSDIKFTEEVLKVKSVQKKTKAGQRTRFKAWVLIGDRNGHIGIGHKSHKEVQLAIKGAIEVAKLSMFPIRLGYWGNKIGRAHTVPFKITGKTGSVSIKLIPAPKGTGIIGAPTSKKVLEMAGVRDCYTSSTGKTKTKGNFMQATFHALSQTYTYLSPDFWGAPRLQRGPLEAN